MQDHHPEQQRQRQQRQRQQRQPPNAAGVIPSSIGSSGTNARRLVPTTVQDIVGLHYPNHLMERHDLQVLRHTGVGNLSLVVGLTSNWNFLARVIGQLYRGIQELQISCCDDDIIMMERQQQQQQQQLDDKNIWNSKIHRADITYLFFTLGTKLTASSTLRFDRLPNFPFELLRLLLPHQLGHLSIGQNVSFCHHENFRAVREEQERKRNPTTTTTTTTSSTTTTTTTTSNNHHNNTTLQGNGQFIRSPFTTTSSWTKKYIANLHLILPAPTASIHDLNRRRRQQRLKEEHLPDTFNNIHPRDTKNSKKYVLGKTLSNWIGLFQMFALYGDIVHSITFDMDCLWSVEHGSLFGTNNNHTTSANDNTTTTTSDRTNNNDSKQQEKLHQEDEEQNLSRCFWEILCKQFQNQPHATFHIQLGNNKKDEYTDEQQAAHWIFRGLAQIFQERRKFHQKEESSWIVAAAAAATTAAATTQEQPALKQEDCNTGLKITNFASIVQPLQQYLQFNQDFRNSISELHLLSSFLLQGQQSFLRQKGDDGLGSITRNLLATLENNCTIRLLRLDLPHAVVEDACQDMGNILEENSTLEGVTIYGYQIVRGGPTMDNILSPCYGKYKKEMDDKIMFYLCLNHNGYRRRIFERDWSSMSTMDIADILVDCQNMIWPRDKFPRLTDEKNDLFQLSSLYHFLRWNPSNALFTNAVAEGSSTLLTKDKKNRGKKRRAAISSPQHPPPPPPPSLRNQP